jgi:hypothetical protein
MIQYAIVDIHRVTYTSKLIFMQRSLAVGAILANREAVLHKSVTCDARFRYLLAEVNLGTGT